MSFSLINISDFIKQKRKVAGLTQADLSAKTGVGIRFIRELESGKSTLKINKVNQVLKMFGYQLGPTLINRQNSENEES